MLLWQTSTFPRKINHLSSYCFPAPQSQNFDSNINSRHFFSPLCAAAARPPLQSTQVSTRNHSMVESVLQMLQVQQLCLFCVFCLQLRLSAPPADLLPALFSPPALVFYTPSPSLACIPVLCKPLFLDVKGTGTGV